ncbi:uncharacterized protein MONOS_11337 [Monocercomonoides exilis]|uniref:uncharacterized protein n=1 Tax=Monocercomonoides exilis TaxID=2049356 RepID=UPI00355A3C36|nr:hypothetical protein MONOS_11337 [Monocercomonoides exilis]|eukprot:MONOS_11337.1-p1 / transcript=MONOS_11337.1 / gene=MONOS_11337 / organism=Monocercomonoides_exilis_PA203 / gene_product=unspecified product / transcript_product=unspecified product / location=Mono_scaffold00563:40126-40422(+) / protein_length=99 / sequence_SO=supercontig / SO=protein_coding / is_pseudo=false
MSLTFAPQAPISSALTPLSAAKLSSPVSDVLCEMDIISVYNSLRCVLGIRISLFVYLREVTQVRSCVGLITFREFFGEVEDLASVCVGAAEEEDDMDK